MLKVKLDAANNELECTNKKKNENFKIFFFNFVVKQTLIQSGIDNANQLDINGQKAIDDLEKIKQVKFYLKFLFYSLFIRIIHKN